MNREDWLNKAVDKLKEEFFTVNGLEFEFETRISTGWCRGSKLAIGQCWSAEASAGNFTEIFIAPNVHQEEKVLATVLHELIHAHLGTNKKHGKEFKALVKLFGLAGKVTATYAEEGSELFVRLTEIAKSIGEYPHKHLMPDQPIKEKIVGGKSNWLRFKSVSNEAYRVMVSPKSLLEFGIPLDPLGVELVPTNWVAPDSEVDEI